MSDALRGAAETAPVEDAHVSIGSVRSRARRNRAIRVGANGIVGVGAAALIFAGVAGVVANQTGLPAAEADGGSLRDDAKGGTEPAFVGNDSAVAQGGAAYGCGAPLDFSQFPAGDVTAAVDFGGVDGNTAQFKIRYETTADGSYTPDSPTVYVVWNDLVVAAGPAAGDSDQLTVTAAENAVRGAGFDLVNCWDGAALPAGDYTLVTVTGVSAAVPPVEEPTGEPAAEPSAVDPDTSVSSDAAGDAADIAVEPLTYAVSEAVAFTVAGDPVKDPFQQYLNPVDPVDPNTPAAPDDVLTSEEARAAYEAALAGKWNMAPGTQRVVKSGDGKDTDPNAWAAGYYGCPTDGVSGAFPKESADLDWLGVDANLPSSIHVSYGWVVDGNPLVHYGITNNTEWSLPGFYQGSAPRLVLVKDGRVVAEAYPVNPNQNGGVVMPFAADGDIAAATEGGDKLIYAPEAGYLAPGASLSGDYLWRDLSGCWTANGTSTVDPGTYTVLSAQDIYLGGMYTTAYGSEGGVDDVARDAVAPSKEPSLIMAPAPDESDYVSFTVWTSLGSITVTN